MANVLNLIGSVAVTAAFLLGAPTGATAQTLEPDRAQSVITETFDGGANAPILGGQIDLQFNSEPWFLSLRDGTLVMENLNEPKSLHYNDIAWVKFPNSDRVESTEALVISTVVESKNTSRGGAGFIVGSGKLGRYVMFSVDGSGNFHVLQKDGRTLRAVHSGAHPSIIPGGQNTITFEVKGAHLLFRANGAEIIQVPYPSRMGRVQQNGRAGIGLAAFGTGTYIFDTVEISRD